MTGPRSSRGAVFTFLGTIAVVLAVYAPQLRAPFELQDDHRIIAPLVQAVPRGFTGALQSWAAEVRGDIDGVGRFRPVNQVFDVIGPRVLGADPLRWHLCLLALAAAVTALLFHAAFRLYGSATAAAAFALITMLAPDPGPTSAWYRLGPKEAWGMLFLAGALAAMLQRREVLSFVLVALCAYSKESFLLLVPALFGVRLWLEVRASEKSPMAALRELRWPAVAYAALFLAGLAGVLLAVRNAGAQSYGGSSLAAPAGTVAQVLARDVARAPLLAAGFVPALLALLYARRRSGRTAARALAAVVFLAWVGPQYALHATRGGFWDHYWLPCVVAFAAVNAAGIAILARESRMAYAIALAVCAVWSINAVRIDALAVRNFVAKATVQQEAVRIASSHVTPQSDLVMLGNPTHGELAFSFADFVKARGGRFRRAVLYDWPCEAEPCRTLDPRLLIPVPPLRREDAGVVVRLAEEAPGHPFDSRFERHDATGSRGYLSLRQRKWVSIPFVLRVEVRQR